MGISVGAFAFILSIVAIVLLKGSVSLSFRDNTLIFAIIVLVLAVTVTIVCIVAIMKIFKANNLYLQVGAAAGTGKIAVRANSPLCLLQ